MYRFHDKQIDTELFLQLQDLTSVLSRQTDLKFEYNYGSYIDMVNHTITGSTFWNDMTDDVKVTGYKTDLFLRAIGNMHYTDIQIARDFHEKPSSETHPDFSNQLFTLLENNRLEEKIKKIRPGTASLFEKRKQYLKHYFTKQLNVNVTRGYALDELFSLIYLVLQADEPDPSFPQARDHQIQLLQRLKPIIYNSFEAESTRDIVQITRQIISMVDERYKDMINEYYIFPVKHIETMTEDNLFDELTRIDPLDNDDEQEVDEEDSESIDETFSSWHQENKNEKKKQTFLQFELEQGTKTNILGGGARETEDGDQATASIQGSAGESKQNDYSDLETLEKEEDKKQGSESAGNIYGEENKNASIHIKHTTLPSEQEILDYEEMVKIIDPIRRKLAKTIENTLEHNQNMPRQNLVMGRLSKKLLPLFFDENPRVFYKKDHESKEIDAAFTLLVDCSASMHDKMDETKLGITLFHEVLKQLSIPHSIIGFWEDATGAKDEDQPNYFHVIHSFDDSLFSNGAKIMQLEPQEDNRDGFSIRVVAKKLEARREKNKFLLVFSDGEPAAMNYEDNGLVDTHQAVFEARKRNIDVIGMFLAHNEITEKEDFTMKNIYGKQRMLVPHVEELHEQFAPLLKKLLLKTL